VLCSNSKARARMRDANTQASSENPLRRIYEGRRRAFGSRKLGAAANLSPTATAM
jgi:hypothetical protein